MLELLETYFETYQGCHLQLHITYGQILQILHVALAFMQSECTCFQSHTLEFSETDTSFRKYVHKSTQNYVKDNFILVSVPIIRGLLLHFVTGNLYQN